MRIAALPANNLAVSRCDASVSATIIAAVTAKNPASLST
jgi:hypothetical protein